MVMKGGKCLAENIQHIQYVALFGRIKRVGEYLRVFSDFRDFFPKSILVLRAYCIFRVYTPSKKREM